MFQRQSCDQTWQHVPLKQPNKIVQLMCGGNQIMHFPKYLQCIGNFYIFNLLACHVMTRNSEIVAKISFIFSWMISPTHNFLFINKTVACSLRQFSALRQVSTNIYWTKKKSTTMAGIKLESNVKSFGGNQKVFSHQR